MNTRFAKALSCVENEPMMTDEARTENTHRPAYGQTQRRTKKGRPSPTIRFWRGAYRVWGRLFCGVANAWRRLRRGSLPDYVVITLRGDLQERDPERPWFFDFLPGYRPPQTLESLQRAFDRIADDPDVRGVLLLFKDASISLAQAQSLAALFERFRRWSLERNGRRQAQRIVAFVEQGTTAALMAASAADQLILAPLADWSVLGLRAAPLFLRRTLAQLGVEMEVVRVAPWKTAADPFIFDGLTEEARTQYEWLLDSLYSDLVEQIARGRKLAPEQVRALIDRAPLTAQEALEAGLVDALAYEDELPTLLGDKAKPARLKAYRRVHALLYRRVRPPAEGVIGVITLNGSILPGESRSFPIPLSIFGEETIGSATAQQIIRAARQNKALDAVIVCVDSPGGSALASDLIWRELTLLDAEKPVIVYMGDVAASGGYYISAPGRKIVAQRATLTGSIGVIFAKVNLKDAFAKIGARRDEVKRGAHADIYSDVTRWQGELMERIEQMLNHIYAQFKARVVEGRKLDPERIESLAGGRVWTGAQALTHGLIDAVGDFQRAVDIAAAEAGLADARRVALIPVTAPRRWLPPAPLEAAQRLAGGRRSPQLTEMSALVLDRELQSLLERGAFWLIEPDLPKFY